MSQISLLQQQPTEFNVAYPTRTLLLRFATVFLGISFFLAEHSLKKEFPAEEVDAKQTFSISRQIGIASVGVLGCILLVARGGRPLVFNNALAKMILALGAVCLLSILWSDDIAFTIRRLGGAVLCFIGVLGFCRQFSPRDLCKMVLVLSVAYVCAGVASELGGIGYSMEAARYRFGGTVNPNLQGIYCALIGLSALCLLQGSTGNRWKLRGLFLFGVAFLLLTGSRTALYSFLLAVAAHWWLSSSPRSKALLLTGVPALLALLVLGYELFVGNATVRFLEVITVGRDVETLSTMTSRIPVWNELIHYIGERPLLGYGYQGFWAGDRLNQFAESLGWAAQSSHNAYLETILSVGLIGGTLHILIVIFGVFRSSRYYRDTADLGFGFVFALIAFATVHSFAESAFSKPLFPCMIFVTGLSMLAFQPYAWRLDAIKRRRFSHGIPGNSTP